MKTFNSVSRRAFLGGGLAVAAMPVLGLEPSPSLKSAVVEPFRFLLCSDIHAQYMPKADGHKRLSAIIAAAKAAGCAFVIQLGDFVTLDATEELALWNTADYTGERFHVLGNHDLDKATKAAYVNGMGMPGRYYSFDRGGLHFVVLDGNNFRSGDAYVPYANGNYYGKPGISSMDPEQLEWLKADLAKTSNRCLLFSHQSVDFEIPNGADVRAVLEAANRAAGFRKVVVAFGGHDHSNYDKSLNAIRYIQINSAAYAWMGYSTGHREGYNDNYVPWSDALYGIVEVDAGGLRMTGIASRFIAPEPSLVLQPNGLPLVPWIKDADVRF